MHLSPPLEPMLARSVSALPTGGRQAVFEQKTDGYRVVVFARPVPFLQSKRGAALAGAFPELAQAAAGLGVEAVLDAELVISGGERLDFAALQQRSRRRGASAERAPVQQPGHLVVFDLLEVEGTNLLQEPLPAAGHAGGTVRRPPSVRAVGAVPADPRRGGRPHLAGSGLGDGRDRGCHDQGPGVPEPARRARLDQWARTSSALPSRSPTSLLLGRFDTAGRLHMVGHATAPRRGHRAGQHAPARRSLLGRGSGFGL
ncbi:ATP-dependent DNA ligase [Streptomyces sp. NPDC056297]|uniref:ATP-dependent DNA ligase n=1 Tax=unclassified Streptomyces TaxID=2593676 RepID=UPI0035DA869D